MLHLEWSIYIRANPWMSDSFLWCFFRFYNTHLVQCFLTKHHIANGDLVLDSQFDHENMHVIFLDKNTSPLLILDFWNKVWIGSYSGMVKYWKVHFEFDSKLFIVTQYVVEHEIINI
jgi:hypothetical protein